MHVYISYVSEDRKDAQCINNLLKSKSIPAWDIIDADPEAIVQYEIKKAIKECTVFVACLSKNSVRYRDVQLELKDDIEYYMSIHEGTKTFIQLFLEPCKVEIDIPVYISIDNFKSDGTDILVNILRDCLKEESKKYKKNITKSVIDGVIAGAAGGATVPIGKILTTAVFKHKANTNIKMVYIPSGTFRMGDI